MLKVFNVIAKLLPKSLLGRSMLILLTPLIVLQAVMGYVFYEYHIEDRLQYSAQRIASEISYVRTSFEKKQDISFLQDFSLSLGRQYHLQDISPDKTKSCNLNSYIIKQFTFFFRRYEPNAEICENQQNQTYLVIIPFNQTQELVLKAYGKEFLSGKWHFLPVWSLVTAIVMAFIAALFLKNQIRPILHLSQALEAFGHGDDDFSFHSSGAIEIRRAGFEFIKMRRRLNTFINERTMMLAGVSHDLRTILTRLKLELSLMPPDEAVDNLKSDVSHMAAILDSYLNFINAIKDEALTLVNIKDEHDTLIGRHIKHHIQCTLHCDIQGNLQGNTLIRKHGFIRCILNLLSNAQRYGTIIILTLSISHNKHGRFVKCIIEDNGTGVAVENYEKIFDPFYSDNVSRTLSNNHGEHLGLGLSIIRNIARDKGGDVIPAASQKLGGFQATLLYAID